MSAHAVAEAVLSALTGDTVPGGVNTLLSGAIYDSLEPPNAGFPRAVLHWFPGEPWSDLVNDSIDGELQVNITHYRRMGAEIARTVAQRVYTKLHRQSLTITGRTDCRPLCIEQGELADDETFTTIVQRYRVFSNP